NGGFLHCIQMDTSVNAANQVVSVGADIAFDADPKFFACLVRFESSSVPTTLPTAYDVYPLDGRHDGGYYIDIQITLKQMLRDFIGIRVNRAKKSGMVNITSSVNSRERSGINTI